jgi:hypothetical protein
MGLALSTGYLAELDAEGAGWFRSSVAIVNQVLADEKLPPHVEPDHAGPERARSHCSSFPYSFLHYLRRAFARLREGQPITPVAKGEDPSEDPAIEDAASTFDAHLLCHSDCEGFYVPVDFAEVIFDIQKRGLAGGMLGSSVRLLNELVEVAPALGIELQNGQLSDDEARKLSMEDDESAPFWHERLVWLALYENARVSVANKTLLVFH